MRLILMGTGPFAVPTFQSLLRSDHDIVGTVTRPVPPARGRRKEPVNPVLEWVRELAVPRFEPHDINAPQARQQLAQLHPDLLVVCDYGQILSDDTIGIASLGGINLHGSLLPKYRGAAPVNWAIWNGETETGVTVIHMTPRLDAGPCLAVCRTPIGPDEDAVELERRLAKLGVEPVQRAIALLATWDGTTPIGAIQDPSQATKAPRLKKSDGQVDWTQPAQRIRNQVRALRPWPGTFTEWKGKKAPLRLILDQVAVATENPPAECAPGQVARCDGKVIWVGTGDGCLIIQKVKPAGKQTMLASQFLRGYPVQVGDRFGV